MLAAGAYVLFLVYLRVVLDFELLRADVLTYWRDSRTIATPFSTWWVPGYAATIAILRALTVDALPPVALMVLIAGTFYLVGVGAVYALARELEIRGAAGIALLFAVYPFVGLAYSVYPVADSMANALLALTLLFYHRRAWVPCAASMGIMLLTHKATWFFALPLFALGLLKHPRSRAWLVLATAPLLGLIVAGALHHDDIFWFMRWSTENLLTSRSSLPVFDGVFGSLLAGGLTNTAKGLIALAVLAASAVVLVACWRRGFEIGVVIAVALLLMAVVVNQYEIWALVRFSKILVVPLGWLLLRGEGASSVRMRALIGGALVTGVVANVAYGFYMAKVFYQ